MKRVKMIALGMAVIVGGLTACGSAKEATTCKTAYAENGQYYVYVDRTSDWGKSVFKDNKLEDKINKDATAEDVVSLMKHVTEVVREKYGVTLEPEVKFLGEFDKKCDW